MGYYPPSTSLILVCILPSLRDYDIARLLGWYRIPLRHAPKIVDVDFLAFYQTGAFGEEHRWQIENFAEVRGHELTRRSELLKDEPDSPKANEEYYKIQLGPVEALPRPIRAGKWRRMTFLYTTGAYVQRAESLKDLVVKNEERTILWSSLRERALAHERYRPDDLPEFPIDPAILEFLGGLAKADSQDGF
jgi:hypothetical protein